MAMIVNPTKTLEPLTLQAWIASLQPSGLLNLLQIPHFLRSNKINVVIKVLLSYMHGGHLWLDCRVDIMINLIHLITGLRKTSVNPMTHFMAKDQEKNLVVRLINKYNLTRGGQAYDAMQIEDKLL